MLTTVRWEWNFGNFVDRTGPIIDGKYSSNFTAKSYLAVNAVIAHIDDTQDYVPREKKIASPETTKSGAPFIPPKICLILIPVEG